MKNLKPSEVARFWSKVDQTGECWLWMGELNNQGYGRFVTYRGNSRIRHPAPVSVLAKPMVLAMLEKLAASAAALEDYGADFPEMCRSLARDIREGR